MIDKIIVKTYFLEEGKTILEHNGAAAMDKDFAAVDQLFGICNKETKKRIKELYSNEA